MARSAAAREDVVVKAGSSDARHYSPALHRPLSYRWVMLGLDALLYFSFGLASSSMAALSAAIGADLHLSPAQLGTVLGSWQAVYVVCALASGLVLDRFGLRPTMTVGALFIGLSACARSFAVDFPSLLIAVALFGVGGPMMSVGSNQVGITFGTGIPLLMALVLFGVVRAGISPLMMLVLMDMREIGAAHTSAAAGLYFTFGEAGGFGGPFLIGVLSGAGGDYARPLVLLAAIQVLIALSALRLREDLRR